MKTLCVLAFALAQQDDTALHAGGSTTLLPVMAQCASEFMEAHPTWDKVDPSLPRRETIIYVTGGGSGFGVKSAVNGTFQIGMASRELKKEEKEKLGDHQTFLVGKDAVAVAVNKDCPLAQVKKSFTKDELARVFAGEIKTWRELDASLPDREIVLLARDAGAGVTEILQKHVLGDRKLSPRALQMPSQGALLKKIEGNASAIAYLSAGFALTSDRLVTFAYEGVAPTPEKVSSGEYALARPLLLVVKGKPSPAAKRFIHYVLNEGQKHVKEQGFVPVKSVGE